MLIFFSISAMFKHMLRMSCSGGCQFRYSLQLLTMEVDLIVSFWSCTLITVRGFSVDFSPYKSYRCVRGWLCCDGHAKSSKRTRIVLSEKLRSRIAHFRSTKWILNKSRTNVTYAFMTTTRTSKKYCDNQPNNWPEYELKTIFHNSIAVVSWMRFNAYVDLIDLRLCEHCYFVSNCVFVSNCIQLCIICIESSVLHQMYVENGFIHHLHGNINFERVISAIFVPKMSIVNKSVNLMPIG